MLEDRLTPSNFEVTNTLDNVNTVGSLRWAIGQANNNAGPDTISFAASLTASGGVTIPLGSQLNLSDTTGKTIITGPGANLVTLSGNDLVRVLQINPNVSAEISGLTLAHGRATGPGTTGLGAGIFNNQGTLTVASCQFDHNSASSGGAIFTNGTLTVIDTLFNQNSARDQGGALDNSANLPGTVTTIRNCTFTSNSCGGGLASGGAVINFDTLFTTDSRFEHNTADFGGGIWNLGNLVVAHTVFDQNAALNIGVGGALDQAGGVAALDDCTFSSNTGVYGGGIISFATLKVTNSRFEDNRAGNYGADVFNDGGSLTLSSNTFTHNLTLGNIGPGLIELTNKMGTSTISDNILTVSGTFSGGATRVFGIRVGVADAVVGGARIGTVDILNNEINGGGVDTPNGSNDSAGIKLVNSIAAGSVVNSHHNTIKGFVNAIQADALAVGTDVNIHVNDLSGNSSKGLVAAATGAQLDARKNWWGGTLLSQVQNQLTGNIAFDPWLGDGSDLDPTSTGFQSEAQNLLGNNITPSSFEVTNTQDNVNTVGSLRWALQQANLDPGDNRITFASGLTMNGPVTITLSGTPLRFSDVSGKTTLIGPGAGLLTLSGNNLIRVLQLNPSVSADLTGVTIAHGRAAVGNPQNFDVGTLGGGIFNDHGTLTLTSCTLVIVKS